MSDRIECRKYIEASKTEPRSIHPNESVLNTLRTVYLYDFDVSGDKTQLRIVVRGSCSARVSVNPETGDERQHGICMREALAGLGFRIEQDNQSPCVGCTHRHELT